MLWFYETMMHDADETQMQKVVRAAPSLDAK